MTTPLHLSVAICAYTLQRWEDVGRAVASVRRQRAATGGPVPAEILLVVDHNPALAARARTALPGVRVLPSTGPPGLSGARNTALAAARGEIVAFLDDDAEAEDDWAAALLAPYADPRVGAVGGAVTPRWDGARPAWFPPEFDWVVGCTHHGVPARRTRVRNVVGAGMSLRRADALAAGGFRTDLGRTAGGPPAGCEETELCLRLAARRRLVLHEPAARVRHRVRAERATGRYFRTRCYAEGRSKAAVARHAGTGPALAAERTYVRSTLPRALARDLRAGALPRTAALLAGLTATTVGYLTARLDRRTP